MCTCGDAVVRAGASVFLDRGRSGKPPGDTQPLSSHAEGRGFDPHRPLARKTLHSDHFWAQLRGGRMSSLCGDGAAVPRAFEAEHNGAVPTCEVAAGGCRAAEPRVLPESQDCVTARCAWFVLGPSVSERPSQRTGGKATAATSTSWTVRASPEFWQPSQPSAGRWKAQTRLKRGRPSRGEVRASSGWPGWSF